MDIIKSNIQNLTNLWSSICKLNGTLISTPDFEMCFVENAEWPRRLWFNSGIDSSNLNLAMSEAPPSTIITTWDAVNGSNDDILNNKGFILNTEQIGMSLSLSKYVKCENDAALIKVINEDKAKEWERLFFSAFGYQIKYSLLLNKPKNLEVFILYFKNKPAGTAMLFRHPKKIIGLHSMGIIPEMQHKGLGKKMLFHLLNLSKENGAEYITLQASKAGLPLYQKLGFETQFTMRNYKNIEIKK